MRPTIFVAVGLGLGFSAVAFGEGYAFSQPSDPACEWWQSRRDLGLPEGCGRGPGEHMRGFTLTSLSTGTLSGPATAIVVFDSEDVQLDHFPFQHSRSSSQ